MFEPSHRTPASIPKYIRVNPDDWEKIKLLAKEAGVTPPELARQAINYALESISEMT